MSVRVSVLDSLVNLLANSLSASWAGFLANKYTKMCIVGPNAERWLKMNILQIKMDCVYTAFCMCVTECLFFFLPLCVCVHCTCMHVLSVCAIHFRQSGQFLIPLFLPIWIFCSLWLNWQCFINILFFRVQSCFHWKIVIWFARLVIEDTIAISM